MRPSNIEFRGPENELADVIFKPDESYGCFAAYTENGLEFSNSVGLIGVASDKIGTPNDQSLMEVVSSDLTSGIHKKAAIVGEAALYLIINDPSKDKGRRLEPILRDQVVELAPRINQAAVKAEAA